MKNPTQLLGNDAQFRRENASRRVQPHVKPKLLPQTETESVRRSKPEFEILK